MRITLISVPYDLGRADVGSGRGPGVYLDAGAAEALRARGHEVDVVGVRRAAPFRNELDAVLDVDRGVAAAVAEALRDGSFPLVVAGNCNVTLGVRAGLQRGGRQEAALLWLDAHGDFNTPDTTESGYLDGMPLAMLCGRAHRDAVEQQLVMAPLAEAAVLHAGGRDFDRRERDSLLASAVRVIEGDELLRRAAQGALAPLLDGFAPAPGLDLYVNTARDTFAVLDARGWRARLEAAIRFREGLGIDAGSRPARGLRSTGTVTGLARGRPGRGHAQLRRPRNASRRVWSSAPAGGSRLGPQTPSMRRSSPMASAVARAHATSVGSSWTGRSIPLAMSHRCTTRSKFKSRSTTCSQVSGSLSPLNSSWARPGSTSTDT